MFSLKEIVGEIAKGSGLSEEEVKKKIEEKQVELSGLVSPEGAAYIVGKELGVNLFREVKKRTLKIKNVIPGMRLVDVVGKVVNISERRDFEKGGRKGSVVNVTIGDETGTARVSLWDREIDILNKLDVKIGDVVKITGGYVKENGMGGCEIRLGRGGRMEKSDIEIHEVADSGQENQELKVKSICDLKEGEYVEVRASLVQIFRKNLFFEVCPVCESRLEREGDAWKCREHNRVEPKYTLVLSGVIDDGSGNVNAVFFRELAEKIIGRSVDELRKMGEPAQVYEELPLGKEFIIRGRLRRNRITERLELVANWVEEADPKKEAEKLLGKMRVKD